jgi:hypothetical protein
MIQRANFIKRIMHNKAAEKLQAVEGERENEKTPHFNARCDNGCNS